MKGARGKVETDRTEKQINLLSSHVYIRSREKNGVMAIAVLFIGQLILPTNQLRS